MSSVRCQKEKEITEIAYSHILFVNLHQQTRHHIMKRLFLTTTATIGIIASMMAQHRMETVLSDGWQFSHDKQTWQTVTVPHDWAIGGK